MHRWHGTDAQYVKMQKIYNEQYKANQQKKERPSREEFINKIKKHGAR
jgi:preprotein translocase subunit Sss1